MDTNTDKKIARGSAGNRPLGKLPIPGPEAGHTQFKIEMLRQGFWAPDLKRDSAGQYTNEGTYDRWFGWHACAVLVAQGAYRAAASENEARDVFHIEMMRHGCTEDDMKRDSSGWYQYAFMACRWVGWCARAVLAAKEAPAGALIHESAAWAVLFDDGKKTGWVNERGEPTLLSKANAENLCINGDYSARPVRVVIYDISDGPEMAQVHVRNPVSVRPWRERYAELGPAANELIAERRRGACRDAELAELHALVARVQPTPPGFAVVPLIPNAAMNRVLAEDDWQWEDVLAAADAITEDQYELIAGAPARAEQVDVPDVDELSNFIRQIDGDNKLGAGAMADKIVDWLRNAQGDGKPAGAP
jgi:hypothetical protein